MLDNLKFVQGAVAKKDYVPALTHFRIKGGRIKGYNGTISISSPIDLAIDTTPKALPFVKAIEKCADTVQINMTPSNRLSIRSGSFRAYIDCLGAEEFPDVNPEGVVVPLSGSLLGALRTLAPFIAEDASRPWAKGILFRGASCFATNNIIVAEKWLGFHMPCDINLPQDAVREILRIGEEPESLQISETNITVHYPGERWLRTQTYSTAWPDLSRILDRESAAQPFATGFFEALESLAPFVDDLGRVFMLGDRMATSADDGAGASVDVQGVPSGACFNHHQLKLLQKAVERIDLTQYPAPCMFYGDGLRGAILGLRHGAV